MPQNERGSWRKLIFRTEEDWDNESAIESRIPAQGSKLLGNEHVSYAPWLA